MFDEQLKKAIATAQGFLNEWKRLQKNKAAAQRNPKLKARWEKLNSSGSGLMGSAQKIMQYAKEAAAWMGNKTGLGELGIAPLIVVGVGAAVVAALGYWIGQARSFNAEVEAQTAAYERQAAATVKTATQLKTLGYSQEQSAAILAAQQAAIPQPGPGLLDSVKQIAIYGGLIAAGVYLLPKLLPKNKDNE